MKNFTIVYHCKRISNPSAEVEKFAEPVKYILKPGYLTIQPNNGSIYNNIFGEFRDYTDMGCATPYEFWDNKINEGDRFYIGIEPNKETELDHEYGYDANYVVNRISKQNKVINFALKSIVEI